MKKAAFILIALLFTFQLLLLVPRTAMGADGDLIISGVEYQGPDGIYSSNQVAVEANPSFFWNGNFSCRVTKFSATLTGNDGANYIISSNVSAFGSGQRGEVFSPTISSEKLYKPDNRYNRQFKPFKTYSITIDAGMTADCLNTNVQKILTLKSPYSITFTTGADTYKPEIGSQPQVTVSHKEAKFDFLSSEFTKARIVVGNKEYSDNATLESHSILVGDLKPNTSYTGKLVLTDESGNTMEWPYLSFKTDKEKEASNTTNSNTGTGSSVAQNNSTSESSKALSTSSAIKPENLSKDEITAEMGNNDSIVIYGKIEPNTDLALKIHSDQELLKQLKSDATGLWSYTITDNLELGDHEAFAEYVNVSGEKITTGKFQFSLTDKVKANEEETSVVEKNSIKLYAYLIIGLGIIALALLALTIKKHRHIKALKA